MKLHCSSSMFRSALLIICTAGLLTVVRANDESTLPHYSPQHRISGVIRNVGDHLGGLLELWEKDFARFQPKLKFQDNLPASQAAIPGLYLGVSDLGPSGAEAMQPTVYPFRDIYRYNPLAITVATGSLDVHGCSPILGLFVNKRKSAQQADHETIGRNFRSRAHRRMGWIGLCGRSGSRT